VKGRLEGGKGGRLEGWKVGMQSREWTQWEKTLGLLIRNVMEEPGLAKI
jgi:hypothetical protein